MSCQRSALESPLPASVVLLWVCATLSPVPLPGGQGCRSHTAHSPASLTATHRPILTRDLPFYLVICCHPLRPVAQNPGAASNPGRWVWKAHKSLCPVLVAKVAMSPFPGARIIPRTSPLASGGPREYAKGNTGDWRFPC